MSLYNLFTVLFITLLSLPAVQAQSKPVELTTVSVSYISWVEMMTLDNGTIVDEAFANFYGTAISYEREKYHNRKGTLVSASALFGQANGGGSQTLITYQKAYQTWFAGKFDYKFAYRVSPQVTVAAGPFVMYRNISWNKLTVQEVKSGADLNMGALLDLRLRFSPTWELQQTFGTMAFKASTMWSLGLGYKF